MIARALAQEPELMILDEPTSHLDIRHKVEVVGILSRMAKERGMTVILALHDVDLAVKGCQYALLVRDGEIAAQGRPEDIVQENTITDLYQINGASYNALLGCMELHNNNPISAFVSAGAGRGLQCTGRCPGWALARLLEFCLRMMWIAVLHVPCS